MQSFTAANVNEIRIRRRDRKRTDRSRWLIIKNRLPRPAVIVRLKYATVHRRHVENVRLRGHTADRTCPPATVRSNVSPTQNRIELSRACLPDWQNNREPDYDCTSKPLHK